jgi:FtsZ-interacting cell division protein YlmF
MSLAENVDKIHEELIEQEGIKLVDLPKPIKAKIKGWNLLYAKLKKSDDETLFRSVQRKSIEIADKIQDFIESDYEEENESSSSEPKAEPKAESNSEEKKAEPKAEPKAEKKESTKVSTSNSSFGNLVMEKKILTQFKENKNGRIRISQLKSIIGKEPDYPEQKVNSITLRKIFMSSEYRLK